MKSRTCVGLHNLCATPFSYYDLFLSEFQLRCHEVTRLIVNLIKTPLPMFDPNSEANMLYILEVHKLSIQRDAEMCGAFEFDCSITLVAAFTAA